MRFILKDFKTERFREEKKSALVKQMYKIN